MSYSNLSKTIALCLGVLVMSCLIGYLVLAWTEPATPPPGGNVPAPLNVGGTAQTKEGGLIIANNSGVTFGLSVRYGNVGIGTTNPTNILSFGGDAARTIWLERRTTAAAGSLLTIQAGGAGSGGSNLAGGELRLSSGIATGTGSSFMSFYTITAGASGIADRTPTEKMRIDGAGNVGIGTASPGAKLHVAGDVIIGATGAGKISVGTIDPLYNIGGEKYSTYTPFMIGLKEETTGVIKIDKCFEEKCFVIIDFNQQAKGSDLWLFYQITDFGKDWENLAILLTPEGRNNVWYELDENQKQIIIYGEKEGRVSFRLTAPRFDHEKWLNISQEEIEGLKVDIKNK